MGEEGTGLRCDAALHSTAKHLPGVCKALGSIPGPILQKEEEEGEEGKRKDKKEKGCVHPFLKKKNSFRIDVSIFVVTGCFK